MSNKNRIPSLVPLTPLAMMDVYNVSMMAMEMLSSATSTITLRNNLWLTQFPTSPEMMQENQLMVTEKMQASMEVGLEMQKNLLDMSAGKFYPWWVTGRRALRPLYYRTTANSRRLSRD
ncbi:hypothetical protein [Pistricoccus aurantiacus]|uniref:hypothetical protein n=1 Tax=Pistricoccus aurantiacus TaxID=1883414 RepID=UPI0036437291